MDKTMFAATLFLTMSVVTPCQAILPGGCIIESPANTNQICDGLSDSDCAVAKKAKFADALSLSFSTDYASGQKTTDIFSLGSPSAIDYVNGTATGGGAKYEWWTNYGASWTGLTKTIAEPDKDGYICGKIGGEFSSENAIVATDFSLYAAGATRGINGDITYQKDGMRIIGKVNGFGSFADDERTTRCEAFYKSDNGMVEIDVRYKVRGTLVSGDYEVRFGDHYRRGPFQYTSDEPLFVADLDWLLTLVG